MSLPSTPPSIHPWIEEFLQSLRLDQGASDHTLSAYRTDLKGFFETLPSDRREAIEKILPTDLEVFLTRVSEAGAKGSSLARKTSTLRQFFKFCCREHGLKTNPAEGLPTPQTTRRLPEQLSFEETERLIEATHPGLDYQTETLRETLQSRDRALVYLSYATGLRVSELTGLTLEQLDLPSRLLRVVGKGNKPRMVPFTQIAAQTVETYLKEHRAHLKPVTNHVFLNHQGLALTRQSFWKILKSLAKKAQIEKPVWPHLMRHTFASHLLESGLNLRSLQLLLGHSDLSTTQMYTHLTPEHLRDVHREFHPRGKR